MILDGSDYERAIPVSSVAEEYKWIITNYPGATTLDQSFDDHQNGPMDVIEIEVPDGSKKKIHFNITKIISGISKQSNKHTLREPLQFDHVKFDLTKEQVNKLNEWLVGVEQRAAALQIEKAKLKGWQFPYPRPLPYHGALGGEITFSFVPNGIGVSCKVTEAITGESIDLSDYDSW